MDSGNHENPLHGVLAGLEIISASKVLGRAEERIVLEITPARVVAAPAA